METTIWICTGIICIVIMSMAYAVVKDITKSIRRLEIILEKILKNTTDKRFHV
jgi:hypothetical protein